MKYTFLLFPVFFAACTSQTTTNKTNDGTVLPAIDIPVKANESEVGILTYCYRGSLQGAIPVQMQFQMEGYTLVGTIQYLATKEQKPIELIGIVEGAELRLLEFAPDGNVTGIITGKQEGKTFVGEWFSPTTRKTRKMELPAVDTTIPYMVKPALPADIGGSYSYSYGEDGPQGTLTLKPLTGGKALLEISAVTSAPARNIADIGPDTVTLQGDRIRYPFPDAPECSFQIFFYKNFATVKYMKDGKGTSCASQFGHNATVEGTFLKAGK